MSAQPQQHHAAAMHWDSVAMPIDSSTGSMQDGRPNTAPVAGGASGHEPNDPAPFSQQMPLCYPTVAQQPSLEMMQQAYWQLMHMQQQHQALAGTAGHSAQGETPPPLAPPGAVIVISPAQDAYSTCGVLSPPVTLHHGSNYQHSHAMGGSHAGSFAPPMHKDSMDDALSTTSACMTGVVKGGSNGSSSAGDDDGRCGSSGGSPAFAALHAGAPEAARCAEAGSSAHQAAVLLPRYHDSCMGQLVASGYGGSMGGAAASVTLQDRTGQAGNHQGSSPYSAAAARHAAASAASLVSATGPAHHPGTAGSRSYLQDRFDHSATGPLAAATPAPSPGSSSFCSNRMGPEQPSPAAAAWGHGSLAFSTPATTAAAHRAHVAHQSSIAGQAQHSMAGSSHPLEAPSHVYVHSARQGQGGLGASSYLSTTQAGAAEAHGSFGYLHDRLQQQWCAGVPLNSSCSQPGMGTHAGLSMPSQATGGVPDGVAAAEAVGAAAAGIMQGLPAQVLHGSLGPMPQQPWPAMVPPPEFGTAAHYHQWLQQQQLAAAGMTVPQHCWQDLYGMAMGPSMSAVPAQQSPVESAPLAAAAAPAAAQTQHAGLRGMSYIPAHFQSGTSFAAGPSSSTSAVAAGGLAPQVPMMPPSLWPSPWTIQHMMGGVYALPAPAPSAMQLLWWQQHQQRLAAAMAAAAVSAHVPAAPTAVSEAALASGDGPLQQSTPHAEEPSAVAATDQGATAAPAKAAIAGPIVEIGARGLAVCSAAAQSFWSAGQLSLAAAAGTVQLALLASAMYMHYQLLAVLAVLWAAAAIADAVLGAARAAGEAANLAVAVTDREVRMFTHAAMAVALGDIRELCRQMATHTPLSMSRQASLACRASSLQQQPAVTHEAMASGPGVEAYRIAQEAGCSSHHASGTSSTWWFRAVSVKLSRRRGHAVAHTDAAGGAGSASGLPGTPLPAAPVGGSSCSSRRSSVNATRVTPSLSWQLSSPFAAAAGAAGQRQVQLAPCQGAAGGLSSNILVAGGFADQDGSLLGEASGVPQSLALLDSIVVVSGLWTGMCLRLSALVALQAPWAAGCIWFAAWKKAVLVTAGTTVASMASFMQLAWFMAHLSLRLLNMGHHKATASSAAAAAAAAASNADASMAGAAMQAPGAVAGGWEPATGDWLSMASWMRVVYTMLSWWLGILCSPLIFIAGSALPAAALRRVPAGTWLVDAFTAAKAYAAAAWAVAAGLAHRVVVSGDLQWWHQLTVRTAAMHAGHAAASAAAVACAAVLKLIEALAIMVAEWLLKDATPMTRTAVCGSGRMVKGLVVSAGKESWLLATQLIAIWRAQ